MFTCLISFVAEALTTFLVTARKRSLGQGHIFSGVRLSTEGSLCMISLPVWLPGPMFVLGGSAYRGGDLLPGGQHPVGFASRESSSRGVCLQGTPLPIRKVGGMHPTWNAFLLGTDFRRLKVWSSTTRMDSWKYWFHFSVKNFSKFDMYLRKDY